MRVPSPQPERVPVADGLPATSPLHPWPLCRKLTAWLEENREAREESQSTGPCSKAELARVLDTRRTTVSNWFAPNCCAPRADTMARLESLMSVSTSYLMDALLPWPPRVELERGAMPESLAGFSREELDAFCMVKNDPGAMAQVMKIARRIERGNR